MNSFVELRTARADFDASWWCQQTSKPGEREKTQDPKRAAMDAKQRALLHAAGTAVVRIRRFEMAQHALDDCWQRGLSFGHGELEAARKDFIQAYTGRVMAIVIVERAIRELTDALEHWKALQYLH